MDKGQSEKFTWAFSTNSFRKGMSFGQNWTFFSISFQGYSETYGEILDNKDGIVVEFMDKIGGSITDDILASMKMVLKGTIFYSDLTPVWTHNENEFSFHLVIIIKTFLLQILSIKIHWEMWTQLAFCDTFKLISRLNIICIFCNGYLKDVLRTSLVKNASNLRQSIDFRWCTFSQTLCQTNVCVNNYFCFLCVEIFNRVCVW